MKIWELIQFYIYTQIFIQIRIFVSNEFSRKRFYLEKFNLELSKQKGIKSRFDII